MEFFIIILCAFFFGFILYLGSLLSTFFFTKSGVNKAYREFYECGFKNNTNSILTLDIQYSLLCIFFLLYDLEIILLVPFLFNIYNFNLTCIFFLVISILLLGVSYIYEWDRYSLYLNLDK